MSHSIGAVHFKSDGKILFYEYNGTEDVIIPPLWETKAELSENWRCNPTPEAWEGCKCKRSEDVEIYSDYGGGGYWTGTSCRHCMLINEPLMPFGDETLLYTDGVPKWAESAFPATVKENS